MATATNSRRDLYSSAEPRPKDSIKKRHASPPKKSSTYKNTVKKPKKELSQEEMSLLTYQSISLLLDAARMLEEAEKKAAPSKVSPAAAVRPTSVSQPKPAVKPAPKQPTPSTSGFSPTPTPSVSIPSRSPAKLIYEEPSSSSSSMAAAALTLLTEQQPSTSAAAENRYSRSPRGSAAAPPAVPTPATTETATPVPAVAPFAPLTITEDEPSAVPLVSPSMPILRPATFSAPPDTLVPMQARPVAALPIPAELADIAVPVAPRSVPTVPRTVKAPKTPRQPKVPAVKKKGKTPTQIASEMERERNFGYPDECRTRIPDAVRRYWARMDKKRRENDGAFFSNYYWK